MLHLLNKSTPIILWETVDSLRCFVLLFSSLYCVIIQVMKKKNIRTIQTLRWVLILEFEANYLLFGNYDDVVH
jgi:ABC-type uncharacterized transport system permease subunit